MDIAHLRAHPEHLPAFLTHQRIRETPVSGGNICATSRLTLDDGTSVFAKTWPDSSAGPVPDGFFDTEARALRWLAEPGAVPVPEVIAALPGLLALEWVEPGDPAPETARRFGADLAALHRSGAATFGAGWPGFIGSLPQDNTPSDGPWGRWFAERRLAPYLKMSADRGALGAADVALVARVLERISGYDDGEAPSRIHGDLWSGNVLWSAAGRAWLVDPAAHGGHRETDLAQLALFGGAPHLDQIIAGYEAVWPLGSGWRARVPWHQLHLLLVHTALFGTAYQGAVRTVAEAGMSV